MRSANVSPKRIFRLWENESDPFPVPQEEDPWNQQIKLPEVISETIWRGAEQWIS